MCVRLPAMHWVDVTALKMGCRAHPCDPTLLGRATFLRPSLQCSALSTQIAELRWVTQIGLFSFAIFTRIILHLLAEGYTSILFTTCTFSTVVTNEFFSLLRGKKKHLLNDSSSLIPSVDARHSLMFFSSFWRNICLKTIIRVELYTPNLLFLFQCSLTPPVASVAFYCRIPWNANVVTVSWLI